ncbi:hypothetical protein ABC337_04835 [Arthrobacter sp. 1P04PC]|uniref:hypothetical protein n=1 Tax=unclassified Arthrobacter TaxID=235627 RepID=UPI0039A0D73B
MISQEQIAKVLAEHWSRSSHTDAKPYVDKCDGCGAVIYTWGDPNPADGVEGLAAHQAAVLAPLFAEAQAEALREAADELARLPYVKPGDDGRAEYERVLAVRRGDTDRWLKERATHIEGRALVAGIHERKKAQG